MGEFKDLINSIIDEQVRGPGNKSGHGLAKKGQISQEPTETRPQTTPMGGGFGGFAHPQAGAGAGAGMRPGSEPSSKEGEFQKDIEKMDDPQPLAPESPLGMLIVKAFDQPPLNGTTFSIAMLNSFFVTAIAFTTYHLVIEKRIVVRLIDFSDLRKDPSS